MRELTLPMVLAITALPLLAEAEAMAETPWDLKKLGKAPKTWPADAQGVEAVFYEGEPMDGKPTRVFAWIGMPEAASVALPAGTVACFMNLVDERGLVVSSRYMEPRGK